MKLATLANLSTFKNQIDSKYAKQTDLTALQTKVSNLSSTVDTITGTDMTALTSRVAANESAITTLNADSTVEGSVKQQVASSVAQIIADAPESYDTLKEIADWISNHTSDASAMNTQINANKNNIAALTALIGTLPEGATSTTIVGYIAEALASYYTKSEVDTKLGDYVKSSDIEEITDAEIVALFAE